MSTTERRGVIRPLLVREGETGGKEKQSLRRGDRVVYPGERRVLRYREDGQPVYCQAVSFNLFGDIPLVNVVIEGSGRKGTMTGEEWTFERFTDLERVETRYGKEEGPARGDLPRMTNYERRLLDGADKERRVAMEILRERLGVEEGDKTKMVLLDGKKAEIVVTDADFGTVVRE